MSKEAFVPELAAAPCVMLEGNAGGLMLLDPTFRNLRVPDDNAVKMT